MTKAKFLFLGTGASTGIPVVGCKCAICTSNSPYNKRLRAAGLIRIGNKNILIDAGPDFRQQALKFNIDHLDGLVLTHTHFDHIGGIDDLRGYAFFQPGRINCLLSQDTMDELKVRYHYLMEHVNQGDIFYAQIAFQLIEGDFGTVDFEGLSWRYVSYFQSGMKVNGYILGDLAYISDIREYSEDVTRDLKGIQTLILGALRYQPSKGHFSIEEAISFARKVGAKKTYLTHVGHELDHEEVSKRLPIDIELAYDGLEIEFDIGKTHG